MSHSSPEAVRMMPDGTALQPRGAARRVALWLAGATLLSLAPACSRRVSAGSDAVLPQSLTQITADELFKSNATTVYDAVEKLRPAMLRGRGRTTLRSSVPATPVVYLDNSRLGPLDTMRSLPLAGVILIRYVSASEAHGRWGPNNTSGVIQVVTSR